MAETSNYKFPYPLPIDPVDVAADFKKIADKLESTFNNFTLTNNAAINGSAITSNSSTFNLLNSGPTTLNIGGLSSTVSIGALESTLNLGASVVKLNALVSGVPSSNVSLAVERGSSPDVAIRWNETTKLWQFTNNGTDYADLGSTDLTSVLMLMGA